MSWLKWRGVRLHVLIRGPDGKYKDRLLIKSDIWINNREKEKVTILKENRSENLTSDSYRTFNYNLKGELTER